jgi:amidase
MPLCETLDTCGFFARDIATFARGRCPAGADANPLPSRPRLLLAADLFELPTPEARKALAPAAARIEAVLGKASPVDVADRPLSDLYWAFRYVQGWEAWRADGALIENYGLQLGPDVAGRFAFSKGVTAAQFEKSSAVRRSSRLTWAVCWVKTASCCYRPCRTSRHCVRHRWKHSKTTGPPRRIRYA